VMSKEAKLPTFLLWSRRFPYLHRPEVLVRYGKPLDLSRYAGKERDRDALREVTDEIMRAILELSGQSYVNEYASRTPALPLPEPWQSTDDDSKLSEEPLAG
jgi:hypothetical protein